MSCNHTMCFPSSLEMACPQSNSVWVAESNRLACCNQMNVNLQPAKMVRAASWELVLSSRRCGQSVAWLWVDDLYKREFRLQKLNNDVR